MHSVNITQNMSTKFIITNMILSMVGTFTCNDVYEKVRDLSLNVTEKTISKIIIHLRENDYLDEIGHSYRVIPKEKSMRWGWQTKLKVKDVSA